MVISLILLLILFILFVPIKLRILTSPHSFSIKIYNLLLFSKEKGLLNNYIKKQFDNFVSQNSNKDTKNDSQKKSVRNTPFNIFFRHKELSISKLYKQINKNKFKPTFKFIGTIDFEIEDAATTAIAFGILSNFNPILYYIFSRIFNVKTLTLDITPHFTGKNIINFSINSIISFNIAQIIYILVLTIRSFEIKKEVAL